MKEAYIKMEIHIDEVEIDDVITTSDGCLFESPCSYDECPFHTSPCADDGWICH